MFHDMFHDYWIAFRKNDFTHPPSMSASTLQQAFSHFRMTDGSGLVPTDGTATHPRAKRILRDADILGASHVLFRFHENGDKPPTPQALIFDRTVAPISPAEEGELHRKVWNTGMVPLMFVIQNDRVDIIGALEKPKLDNEGNATSPTIAAKLKLASDISKALGKKDEKIAQRFSADRFANGTFWDDAENSTFLADSTAQKTLLQEMRNAHKAIAAHDILSPELTRRFFILCLMVKYLEDRKILRADYFTDFHVDATTFENLLRLRDNDYAALRRCLKNLSYRFNGDVFFLTPDEEAAILKADLTPYANFVQGQTAGQMNLWKLYTFEYLPVELISYIYEDFLQHNKEAVYTPHMLVDLVLDEIMPAKGIPDDYRILDPACGSGVFLVGAFRRLVEAYYADNPQVALGKIPAEKLCAILEKNICGVDTDPIAVELTSFSLCVAMCSELTPESARAEMKFPSLAGKIANGTANENRSIRERDFFALTENADGKPGSFDLIIGNPPFGSNEHENLAAKVALDTKGPRVPFPRLPDKQLCYLFLRDAPKLLKEGGVGCLLQKDGFLYNGGVLEFRAAFLQNYDVPKIFDFVSIRQMFTGLKSPKKSTNSASEDEDDDGEGSQIEEADSAAKNAEKKIGYVDVKVVAVFFRRPLADEPLSNKPILHATFRKLFTAGRRRSFDLDTYDYHWVARETAIKEPRVWKANLLGGGRLLATYRAFANHHVRSVGEYIKARGRKPNPAEEKRKSKEDNEEKWICSEGFIAGAKNAKPLGEGIVMPSQYLETDGLRLDGIAKLSIKPLETTRFAYTGNPRLYDPPHLLVKEHESLPCALRGIGETKLGFKDKIVGIKCPAEDQKRLDDLSDYLSNHRASLQFFLSFSSQYLINKQSAILKEDIMDLPFPENGKLEFHGVEEWLVRDVIERQIRFIKVGANAESTLFKPTTAAQLTEYTDTFLQVIRTVYPETKRAEQIEFSNAHCIAFTFGEKPSKPIEDADKLEAHLDELLLKQKGHTLRIHRIVRLFDGDRLYFVKPKAYRFWTRSIAVRDADDAFASLVAQGF